MIAPHKQVDVVRLIDGQTSTGLDQAATEEPLEIRLHGQPFAVIMRTPGADRELAAGFLLSEGVITSADDLGTIEYCTDPAAASSDRSFPHPVTPSPHPSSPQPITPSPHENVLNVTLTGASRAGLDSFLTGR